VTAPVSPLNYGALAATVRSGAATLGTFIGSASPLAAEVCAAAGVDWVLLDLEHGAGGEEQVRDVVPAAGSYGVPTVVRVESAARIRMGRVLDSGAAGIMLPRLDTVDEVAGAVRHLRYPPAGDRGVATAAARRLEQGWSFVAIGSDSTLLAAAVTAEFGHARTAAKNSGTPR
jgi:4-hydroxy-2-oxoheptanedioate aldolase